MCALTVNRKGAKLEKRFQGPYVVAEVMGKDVYRLTTVNGSSVKVMTNSRDLKLFTGDGYASLHKATGPQVGPTQSPQAASNRV